MNEKSMSTLAGEPMDMEKIAEDTLAGINAIAAHIGKSKRQSYHLCETRQIPAFKLAGKWHMRKSTYAALIVRLESEVIKSAS
jgi:hypothetical protein